MNRRYFLNAAGAAVMAIMAGCGQSESKFVGYWQDPGEAKFPGLTHIRPNGDSFIISMTGWEGPEKGYETFELLATSDGSNNILKISSGTSKTMTLIYEETTDQLMIPGEKGRAKRISKENYQAALDRGKAEYELEKAKQKENQKNK